MFTGIIEAVGEIAALSPQGTDTRVRVKTGALSLNDVQLGDSIAVSGVCLTVVDLPGDGFWADVSNETIACTSFQFLSVGTPVNLEKALLPTTRLGGHLVSGHVDGIGEVVSRRSDGRSERFLLRAPSAISRYIAHKGSICIDGTSLTVNDVAGDEFDINIVPHTLSETIIGRYQAGTRVNLEVDLIARYLERLLGVGDGDSASAAGRVDLALLKENGFN